MEEDSTERVVANPSKTDSDANDDSYSSTGGATMTFPITIPDDNKKNKDEQKDEGEQSQDSVKDGYRSPNNTAEMNLDEMQSDIKLRKGIKEMRLSRDEMYNANTQVSTLEDMDQDEEEVGSGEEADEESVGVIPKTKNAEDPCMPPMINRVQLQEPFTTALSLLQQARSCIQKDLPPPSGKNGDGKSSPERTPIKANPKKRAFDEEDEVDFGGTNDDHSSSEEEDEDEEDEDDDVMKQPGGFLDDTGGQDVLFDLSEFNPPMTEEEENSLKFKIICSQSRCNKNKTFRRKLIYSFVQGAYVNTDLAWFFHPNLKNHPLLILMDQILRKTVVEQERACVNGGDHRKLFGMIKLLYWSDQWVAKSLVDPSVPSMRSKRKEPPPIVQLRKYTAELNIAINKTNKNKVKVVKKRKISTHLPGGRVGRERLQDKFARDNSHWYTMTDDLDGEGCPSCGHNNMVHRVPEKEVHDYNTSQEKKFQIELASYNAMSKAQRDVTPKPKRPKMKEVEVMCMCCTVKCRDCTTGRGCPRCEQYAARFGHVDDWDYVANKCQCPHCLCPCSLYFKKRKLRELKVQIMEEQEEEKNKKTPKLEPGAEGRFF